MKIFEYFLACAELCGKNHWSMKMSVIVETEEEYNEWLAGQTSWYEATQQTAEAVIEEE